MRAIFNNDGYLESWIFEDDKGCFNSEKEVMFPNIENLDIDKFYNEYHLYHLVDGKLVKDENRQAELDAQKENEEKELTLNEKVVLFVESLEVESRPKRKEGFEYKPYFDRDNLKFSWREFKK